MRTLNYALRVTVDLKLSIQARIFIAVAVALLALIVVSLENLLVLLPRVEVTVVSLAIGLAAPLWLMTSTRSQLGSAIRAVTQASSDFTASAANQASGSSEEAAAVGQITETIEQLANRTYDAGFVTDIESETAPPGLSEDIVRFISQK